MRHHSLAVVPTPTPGPTALRAKAPRTSLPALDDSLLSLWFLAFPETARLVGVVVGDLVVLFDPIHRFEAGDVHVSATRSHVPGH